MPKRRPIRRPSKPDAVLAAAIDEARSSILEVADDSRVGEHLGVVPEAERLVTHRFAAQVPGYAGWQWFATLARVPRGKDATVCEVGLLPSDDSLLAPAWVPWSDRVRPEDSEQQCDAPTPDVPDSTSADTPAPEAEDNSSTPGGESPVA